MKNKNKAPFFSIITCTYNSEKYLETNINSISSQNFEDYEHIFIDGYSTDKTIKIIRRYKTKYPDRVKLYLAKPKGMVNAMNVGIKKARGRYLLHLHSDDALTNKHALSHSANYISKTNIDWFFGSIKVLRGKKIIGTFPRRWYKVFMNRYTLQLFNFVPHQSTFINRNVFKKFGNFDEKVPHLSEYEYWLRISAKTHWSFDNYPIAVYRQWEGSSSFNKDNTNKIRSFRNKIQNKYLTRPYIYVARIVNFFVDKYSNYNMAKK